MIRTIAVPMTAAALLAAGCSRAPARAESAEPAPAAAAAPALPPELEAVAERLEAARAEPAAPRLSLTGEFLAPVRSELVARQPGRVSRVLVDEGQRVRRGQPLLELETEYAQLERERAQAELSRTRAAAQEARRDFERKRDLLVKGSVSQALHDRTQATWEQAQAAEAAAQAALGLAEQRLADAVLRAPIDGVVAERRTDVGERLGDSTVAFVIEQTAPLKLRFQVPERHLRGVAPGAVVRASVDPYPGEVFTGRVIAVGGSIDAASRTFFVDAEFANADGRLRPGLFARVETDLDAES